MDEWVLKLEQALYRLADGDVSDDDVAYIVANIPKVENEFKVRLQMLVDEPHEQRNVQAGLAAINTYRMWKLFS